jgi:hypothetical protein
MGERTRKIEPETTAPIGTLERTTPDERGTIRKALN